MNLCVHAIVLNCNGERWLERCLESLLDCSYPRLQVVLLDNASTDGSVALARGVSSKIEILQNDVNLGFCAGNNRAIDWSLEHGADYVAVLNNDTYFERDWLDRLIEVGEANPQLGILGPVQLVFDGDEFNSWTTSALAHLLEKLQQPEPGCWFSVDWVEGSCLVAKRSVFERVGRFDPIFSFFFEEMDFCRRARAAGFEVAIVPSSKIHHWRSGSFQVLDTGFLRRFLLMRNSIIYSSADPGLSFLQNVRGLLRTDAVHLKDALSGKEDVRVWFKANLSILGQLRRMYRKWQTDRAVIAGSGATASAVGPVEGANVRGIDPGSVP